MTDEPLDTRADRRPEALADTTAWASFVLGLAALYNLCWGFLVIVAPAWCLHLVNLDPAANLPLVQCIGMLVGVYGLAYGIAASAPARHWPLVFVGLVGKVAGPIGAVWAIQHDALPIRFLWVNVFNDVIWLAPFGWILASVGRGAIPGAHPWLREQPIYEGLLGPAFGNLAAQLRRFHGAREPIEVEGSFAVVRPAGAFRNWVADREGFPRATDAIGVHLRVEPLDGQERWMRRFGATTLTSTQWEANGLLAERLGVVTLYLRVEEVDGALLIRSVRSTALGMPLPPFFCPRVTATGHDTPHGIRIFVRLELAPVGVLVEYAGVVSIIESTSRSPAS
jgi:Domain of unknown function (DUF4166)